MSPRTGISRRTLRAVASLVVVVAAGVTLVAPAAADHVDGADAIETLARDVFVVVGASLRNPDASTPLSADLYNVAGLNLGVTWGEWSAGTATSEVRTVHEPVPHTEVSLGFDGLVPLGVYSVFWATIGPDSENPLCPGVERSLPLPSVDPAQAPDASSFVAGPDGTATFDGRLEGATLASAQQVFFSIVYHADGQTYGSLPNRGEFLTQGENCRSSYGHDAMRQFLVLQQWEQVASPTAVEDRYDAVPRTAPFTSLGSVLDNDTGAALVARLDSPPQYGTVTLAENGTFTYTLTDPAAPVTADGFTYTTCATPTSCSAPATVTLALCQIATTLTADPATITVRLTKHSLTIPATYRATLAATATGAPLASRAVDFSHAGAPACSATTNSAGVAMCSTARLGNVLAVLAGLPYTATFSGTDIYAPATATSRAMVPA